MKELPDIERELSSEEKHTMLRGLFEAVLAEARLSDGTDLAREINYRYKHAFSRMYDEDPVGAVDCLTCMDVGVVCNDCEHWPHATDCTEDGAAYGRMPDLVGREFKRCPENCGNSEEASQTLVADNNEKLMQKLRQENHNLRQHVLKLEREQTRLRASSKHYRGKAKKTRASAK